jgi:Flp pilus assembly protein TadB
LPCWAKDLPDLEIIVWVVSKRGDVKRMVAAFMQALEKRICIMSISEVSSSDPALRDLDSLLPDLQDLYKDVARDVLLAQIPTVLRADLYAVAALVGAAIVVIANLLHLPSGIAALAAALCFGLRIMAMKHGRRLPVARAKR